MDLQRLLKNKWLLFLAAVGILLLLVGSFFPHRPAAETTVPPDTLNSFGNTSTNSYSSAGTTTDGVATSAETIESNYDAQLENILAKIQGIHAITVMVTVGSTGSLTVAKDNSSSQTVTGSGSTTSKTTSHTDQIYSNNHGVGTSGPFVLSTTLPSVLGVLVTVNADDFIVAKSEIIEAITNVLDVPAYKISVEPQKGD